jgi:hypothetical protein
MTFMIKVNDTRAFRALFSSFMFYNRAFYDLIFGYEKFRN